MERPGANIGGVGKKTNFQREHKPMAQAAAALTKSSPPARYMPPMIRPRQFGKLGNRGMARLTTGIDGGMVLPERSASCRVDNVSRTGCRLSLDTPPRLGATVLVRVDRIEALGTVKWVRSRRCGIAFERPLDPPALERLRWIVEHESDHAQNGLRSATAVWR
ncbi:MAG: PilZ domain-containing protein [Sphingomonadaceae bacterium]|nr:PilZ domain-containing protein [Sphingomonadaceae bacterium]